MNKQQLLHSMEHNIYCRLKVSDIHGVGIFAIRDIPAGTNIFPEYVHPHDVEFDKEELEHLRPEVKKMIHDFFPQHDGKVYIPEHGLNELSIQFYLNHSENPNITFNEKDEFVTVRDIKAGEELVSDYKTYSEGQVSKDYFSHWNDSTSPK